MRQEPLPPNSPLCSCTGGVHNCSGSIQYAACPDLFAYQLPPQYSASAYPLLQRRYDTVVFGAAVISIPACQTPLYARDMGLWDDGHGSKGGLGPSEIWGSPQTEFLG